MTRIATTAPDNPEFARVVAVRGLPSVGPFSFDLAPIPAEAAAISRLLDARAVRKLRFQGELAPEGDGWILRGTLGATVEQSCIVTLEPVTTRLDVHVRRVFRPEAETDSRREIEVGADEDDDVEPLGERIDLGRVAVEALALALPPYPRREGAEVPLELAPPSGPAGGTRPFDALAALRRRFEEE